MTKDRIRDVIDDYRRGSDEAFEKMFERDKDELRSLGAFRADVSGAGPTVYGLFQHRRPAAAAERVLRRWGRTWLTVPTWYG